MSDHTDECRYWVTGNFHDCDCKEKEIEPEGRWSKEPFLRVDERGNILEDRRGDEVAGLRLTRLVSPS